MRLPLTMMLLCCLVPLASLADSKTPEATQAPAAEAPPLRPAETAASASAPAASSAASPATQPAAAKAAAGAEQDEGKAIVCKTDRNVGTRFEKKTCRTKSAWMRIEKAAEEDFGAVRNRQVTCPSCQD